MRVLLAVLAAALLAASPVWWASESTATSKSPAQPKTTAQPKQVEGEVKSVDAAKKTVTLDDGTMLMVSDAAKLKELKPGTKIKASYDEKGGQKVTTSIQVMKK